MELTSDMRCFLERLMQWQGVATPSELGSQFSPSDNSIRQRCRRNKLVMFYDGYWRITDAGRAALAKGDNS